MAVRRPGLIGPATASRVACATLVALLSAGTASAQTPASAPPGSPSTAQAPAGLEEVPFITTPDQVTLAMLALAQVGPQDRLLDLGSGDGRIVITAARRFGASGLGVEIDPSLVLRSRANAQAAGVAERARFAEQDLFATDLGQASVITLYLLPDVNLALRPRLLQLRPGTRIVSHDWDMGDWRPDRSLSLPVPDKAIGREKRSQVHLWLVPAPLAGLWCGSGGRQLLLQQRFQQVEARIGQHGAAQPGHPLAADQDTRLAAGHPLAADQDTRLAAGQVQGDTLQLLPVAPAGPEAQPLQLRWQSSQLQVTQASGAWAGWAGLRLSPAPAGQACSAAEG